MPQRSTGELPVAASHVIERLLLVLATVRCNDAVAVLLQMRACQLGELMVRAVAAAATEQPQRHNHVSHMRNTLYKLQR